MSFAADVLALGPAAWYRLDETSGTTATDSSGNSRGALTHSGVTVNQASLLGDGTGKSASYNGSSSFSSTPSQSWMALGSGFTLVARVAPSSGVLSSGGFLSSRWFSSNTHLHLFGCNASGKVAGSVSGGGVAQTATGATSMSAGTTYTIGYRWDGSTSKLSVWLNGVKDGEITVTGALDSGEGGDTPLEIGRAARTGGAGLAWGGGVDELVYFNYPVGDADMSALHSSASGTGAAVLSANTSMAAPSSLAVAASAGRPAAAVMSTPAALAVTATPARAASAAMSAPSTMGVDSTGAVPATAALTAPSTMTVEAVATILPSATMTALSTLSVALAIDIAGTAALAAPSTLTVASTVTVDAAVDMTAPSSLTVNTGAHDAAVAMTAPSVLTATAEIIVEAAPWTLDDTGLALTGTVAASGTYSVDWPAAEIPPNVAPVYLTRQSHQIPAGLITTTAFGRPVPIDAADYPIVEEEVGLLHIWANGVDVTYRQDIPTRVTSYAAQLPFGETAAQVDFPQEMLLTSPYSPLSGDRGVDIAVVDDEGARIDLWSGRIVSRAGGNGEQGIRSNRQCEGPLYAADHQAHPVPLLLPPTDAGTLIARELTGCVSRPYGVVAPVTTGISFVRRGASNDRRLDYVQNLLASMWTTDGDQWTVYRKATRRQYGIARKSTIGTTWTVTYGAPGIEVDLTRDETERINVVWGHGVGPDGYAWQNMFFPGLLPYDPPDYPFADESNVMVLGTRDSDTTTGSGVSTWQARMVELGYRLATDGVLNSNDIAAVRDIQSKRGISVDGQIGPQTWNATWDVGATGAALERVRLPLAADPATQRYLYGANGAILGENPDYDESVAVYESDDIDFGTDRPKASARVEAARLLARDLDPGWTGRVVLRSCPWEGWRGLVREGDRLSILGYEGGTVLVQVASISVDVDGGFVVTCEVDSKSRDAMTLASIMERDRESRADLARRPGSVDRRSRNVQDQTIPFEGESPAGRLPKLAINGDAGLWTVWPVFVSELGTLSKIDLQTTPHVEFSVGVFGAPITANQLKSYVGNPLSGGSWDTNRELLEDRFGYIQSWGNDSEGAGHYPGGPSDPVTGRMLDDSPLTWYSQKAGWLWVAIFTASSASISGRIYPAPVV